MGLPSFIAIGVIVVIFVLLFLTGSEGEPTTYGSATWLDIGAALRKGYFKGKGILVGDWAGLLPVHYEDTHAITLGPSGSGKGTSAILPNLLDSPYVFLFCPGGENTAIVIKDRRAKGDVLGIINPFSMHDGEPWNLPRHGFNPLDILDPRDPQFAAHAELLADLLTPRSGKEGGSSQFFKDSAQGWKQAVIIYIMVRLPEKDRHLGTLYRLCNLPARDWKKLLKDMQKCTAAEGLVAIEASAMERREVQAPEEFSAIMSTVQQDLRWLADPLVRENLKRSDVDFGALKGIDRHGNKVNGCLISVVLPLEYSETHAAITRLALGCAIWTMQRAPLPRGKVLFIIDEAASLQKITRFPNWLATLRKYRVVLWPIFQNIGQVKALYGQEWDTFIANCGLRQFLGAADLQTAQYAHHLLGEHTTHTISVNHEGKENTSEAKRSLMTVDEILYLDSSSQIVFSGSDRPMRLIKTPYWERPEFRGRFNPNPYIEKRTPRNFSAPFKKAIGDLFYAIAWATAPHPTALKLYLIAITVAGFTIYFDVTGTL
ncbi:type IV secretory system conjugative DNA transfer family protein [Acidimangrovimonas pyrenivorans]|uniref:Type IV secretory system conjugative DNA transfer family protein n=1 Tax=Acidimangrovimonas pyrenivorans TaxID=2030798 RepID=A0ABV7ACI5_9RHOB